MNLDPKPKLSFQEIEDLDRQGKILYIKVWNGSNRVEYMDRREWFNQVRDFSGVSITEIKLVAFNWDHIQAPACQFYIEVKPQP